MTTLAIETSDQFGSVALLDGEQVVGEIVLERTRRSAQSLAPAIKQLIAAHGDHPRGISLVAVVVGPGSFTGLRVGVTTAKVFAYALKASCLGVSAFDVIARQTPLTTPALEVIIDAHRNELFAQQFRSENTELGERWVPSADPRIVTVNEFSLQLGRETLVTGPALEKYGPLLPDWMLSAHPETRRGTAVSLGMIAQERFLQGERVDPFALNPIYMRQSAAEEKNQARFADEGKANAAVQEHVRSRDKHST